MESVLSVHPSSLESSSSPLQSHVHMRTIAMDTTTTASTTYADVSGPVVHVASIKSPHVQVKSDIVLMTQGVNCYCPPAAHSPSPSAQPLPAAHSPPSAHGNVMARGGGSGSGVGRVGRAGWVG